LFSIPYVRLAVLGQPQTSLVSPYFPQAASDWMDESGGENIRLFSMPEWGGYLIWRHYPEARVFIDGRVELFPVDFWNDYIRISSASPEWLDLLQSYKVSYLVLSKENHKELIQAVKTSGLICPFEDRISVLCKLN